MVRFQDAGFATIESNVKMWPRWHRRVWTPSGPEWMSLVRIRQVGQWMKRACSAEGVTEGLALFFLFFMVLVYPFANELCTT